MTEWIVAIVAIITVLLSVVCAAVTATWIVARSSIPGVNAKQLSDTKAGIYTAIDVARKDTASSIESLRRDFNAGIDIAKNQCGEGLAAFREHVRLFELYVRDHFAKEDDLRDLKMRTETLGELKVKVDTMWSFQMRRGMSEVVEKGIGTMSSPLIFTDQAKAALETIKNDLVCFYNGLSPTMSDPDVLLELERKFGDQLLTQVCIPFNLTHGACLLLAYSVARQDNSLALVL